jgi:hypothetical protein
MKTTELFVEQTLTGFLILTAAAVPFVDWESLEDLPEVALSSAAGAIGVAYLLGVIFDRFADTLLERFNRWKRILFAIELKEENKALSPDDPFPEDELEIQVIHQGDEAWEWMDYIRSRIRVLRAMAAFVPTLTVSMELTVGFRDRPDLIGAVLFVVVGAYLAAFVAGLLLEQSSWRLPKTYDLRTAEDCRGARDKMRVATEPAFWLAVFLFALGLGLIALGSESARLVMAAVFAAGAVLTAISAWAWWRTTETFLEFLRDFRKWAPEKKKKKEEEEKDEEDE